MCHVISCFYHMIHRKSSKLVMDQLIGVNIRPVELEVYTKCVQTDLTLEGKV